MEFHTSENEYQYVPFEDASDDYVFDLVAFCHPKSAKRSTALVTKSNQNHMVYLQAQTLSMEFLQNLAKRVSGGTMAKNNSCTQTSAEMFI